LKGFLAKLALLVIATLFLQVSAYEILNRMPDRDELSFYSEIITRLPRNVRLAREFVRQGREVIFFGDSVDLSRSHLDGNKSPLHRMIQDRLPGQTIGPLVHEGYNMDTFLAYAGYISSSTRKPRLVIIPVNMRSFSPQWDADPSCQFDMERQVLSGGYLKRVFLKPLILFGAVKQRGISREEYENTPVFNGSQMVGRVRDFLGESFREPSDGKTEKKLVFHYMYSLEPGHRKLVSMAKMANVLKRSGIKPLFYITPIDRETGDKYLGPDFTRRIKANTAIIKQVLTSQGMGCLDLSLDLPAGAFHWQPNLYPNEHLNEKGRLYVAARVAREAEKALRESQPTGEGRNGGR
jgi:hypothetical protein